MGEVIRVDPNLVSCASVLQLIEGQALSGRLVVEMNGLEAGWADFLDGRPVAASCGSVQGRVAVLDLMVIEASTIRFLKFETGRQPAVKRPLGDVLSLVLEGCRVRDEYVRLREVVPAPPGGTVPEPLSDALRLLLARLDGRTSVADALVNAGVSPAQVIDELRAHLDRGFLVQVPEPPPMHTGSMSFFGALDAARRHFRSGDLDRAESQFLLALTLQPDHAIARQNLRRVREVRARQWIERIPQK